MRYHQRCRAHGCKGHPWLHHPGQKANFAVFEKSPLEDIHAILDCSMTVLGGEVVFEK